METNFVSLIKEYRNKKYLSQKEFAEITINDFEFLKKAELKAENTTDDDLPF